MNITIYCGSNFGTSESIKKIANDLANWIIDNNFNLVYGGANVGLMKIIADVVLSGGCNVYGVMTKDLASREITHEGLTRLEIVDDMHQRKMKMFEYGDIYIALPGGPGTLEEIIEVISWKRIGIHNKKCVLFNVDGFYNDLLNQFNRMLEIGFITEEEYNQVTFINDISQLNVLIRSV